MKSNKAKPSRTDEKGRRLRRDFEHVVLERLIETARREDDDTDKICKLLHTYCELKKHDVAAEKNQLQPAKTAATADRASPKRQPSEDLHLTEPYGRKADGESYTQAEFQHSIRRTIHDLYGIHFHSDLGAETTKSPDSPDPKEPDRSAPDKPVPG